jgi:hypothetical protein
MADNRYKQVQAFNAPTAYDQQMVEARRRRRMAEALAQQAYVPQDVGVAPIPAAAPLVQGLQAFLSARAARKADEAEEKAAAEVTRTGEQIAGRLAGGAPVRSLAPADASGLQEVAVTSEYQRSPDDALRVAMTSPGTAAVKGNPMLAAMLARTMEKPEVPSVGAVNPSDFTPASVAQYRKTGDFGALVPKEPAAKAPTTVGGMMFDEASGRFVPIPGYEEQQGRIAAAKRPDVVVTGGDSGRLVSIIGADGKPRFVRESEAVGQIPFTARSAADIAAEETKVERNRVAGVDTNYALQGLAELVNHPGRKAATGASSRLGAIPGTDARGFVAKLDTFKAQTFLPMVKAMVGMGALSNAEGQRVTDAVGALNPEMPEKEFAAEMQRIGRYLYEKGKAGGLDVELPPALGGKPAASGGSSRSNW